MTDLEYKKFRRSNNIVCHDQKGQKMYKKVKEGSMYMHDKNHKNRKRQDRKE